MSIYEGRLSNFDKLVNEGVVLLDFYSDHCVPCKMFAKILEKINCKIPCLNIVKVNASNYPELACINRVSCYPTIIFLKNGREVDRHLGFMDCDTVINKLRQIIR